MTELTRILDAPEQWHAREALTFDDVLLRPGHSEVLPGSVDIGSRITRSISVNLPIISAAMDTVTEANLAIAMAQAGGMGVIHRNLEPEQQAADVARVKRFESGVVRNPITIHPEASLAEALDLMRRHGISGLPVTRDGGTKPSALVGILTHRDVRFASNPAQPVAELMTRERLITVREGVSQEEAKRLLHQYRIEKLLVVDESNFSLHRPDDGEGYREGATSSARLQGRAGTAPGGGGLDHGR